MGSTQQQWTVETGFWNNEAKGSVLGYTLTASPQSGLVLVSAIAIFVGMLSGHMWGIVCFAVHQFKCNRNPNDGLYHQRQVLLRNSEDPASAVWQLMKLGRAWRGRAGKAITRVLPLILIGLVQMILFTAAGIFSSQIFNRSDEVLVRSKSCGYLVGSLKTDISEYNATDWAQTNAASIEAKTAANWANTYARACYGKYQDPSNDCQFFAKSQIHSTSEVVSCPFADKMCKKAKGGALRVDSGYINTADDLGMNSDAKISVDYRRVTTCAPIVTDGFLDITVHDDPNSLPGQIWFDYYYGPYSNSLSKDSATDYTFSLDSYVGNGSATAYASWYRGYMMDNAIGTSWTPIPELLRNDSDLTLIMTNTNLVFSGPVHDLWFEATMEVDSWAGLDTKAYLNTDPIIVMNCMEQHQFCDPGDHSRCSPLTGYTPATIWASNTFSGAQLDVFYSLSSVSVNNMFGNMIGALSSNAIRAKLILDFETTRISAPLPDGQWITEIKGWHDYLLARLQRLVVNVATGPTDPQYNAYVTPPDPTYTQHWNPCAYQKVRDSRYYSFSLLGLVITLGVGLLIILLNLTLSSIVGWLQQHLSKWWPRGAEKREDWLLDGLFQIQRIAWDESKLGTWHYKDQEIPVTLKSDGFKNDRFGKPRRTVHSNSSYQELKPQEAPSLGYTYADSTFDSQSRHFSTGSRGSGGGGGRSSSFGFGGGDTHASPDEVQSLTGDQLFPQPMPYSAAEYGDQRGDIGDYQSYASSTRTRDFV